MWKFDETSGILQQDSPEDSYFALDNQGKWEKRFLTRSLFDEWEDPWWNSRPVSRGDIPGEALALVPEGFESSWALRKEREREGQAATQAVKAAQKAAEEAARVAVEVRRKSSEEAVRRAKRLVADSLEEVVPESHWTTRRRVEAVLEFVANLPDLRTQVKELGELIPEGEEFDSYRRQLSQVLKDLEG